MNPKERLLVHRRGKLLAHLATLLLLLEGSYLERWSTCTRPHCACHRGRKHGPRSYVVLYRDRRQRQVYVPQSQRRAVRQGLAQYDRLRTLVQAITDVNLALMRAGRLAPSRRRKGDRP